MNAISRPALKVFHPLTYGPNLFVRDISEQAIGWRRSIRSQGGYWIGTFQMSGTLEEMSRIFYKWLGYHLEESSGGFKTWEGMIYEIDLEYRGSIRRKSMDFVRNYWTALYMDDEGETQETAAVSDAHSIERYGRYEGLITMDQLSSTAAAAMCSTYLNYFAWPYPQGVSLAPTVGDVATLDFMVCGYIFTCNWRFESIGDGTQDNLSDWIQEIITTDCEFVENALITSNTLQVYKMTSQPARALDVINSLVSIGDANGVPYRFYIGNDRMAYYKIIDPSPHYYYRQDRIEPAGGSSNDPWRFRPGVVRDMNWGNSEILPGGWLTDARDFYASEIDVGIDTGVMITTELFDESELRLAQVQFLDRNKPPDEEDEE